jgi:hypothetical protein
MRQFAVYIAGTHAGAAPPHEQSVMFPESSWKANDEPHLVVSVHLGRVTILRVMCARPSGPLNEVYKAWSMSNSITIVSMSMSWKIWVLITLS